MLPPPEGRRPVVLLTRTGAIRTLSALVAAPVTRTVRGIASEVLLGAEEGMKGPCAANCDWLVTVRKESLDAQPTGRLGPNRLRELDDALRYALGISDWPRVPS